MSAAIYKIENRVNGKCYVGSAVDFRHRKNVHLSQLRHGKHHNIYLQRSFNKYGAECFKFEILELVDTSEELIPLEQHYLDTLKPEYNISPTAGSLLGHRHTEEARRKISKAVAGRKNPNYGCKHTAEVKRMISKLNRGRKHTEEERRKMSETMKGLWQNPDYRRKMSEAAKGRKHTEETRRKISEANRGENAPHAKLTEADVREIRFLADRAVPYRDICTRFGISRATVSNIKYRKTWAHVEG